MRRYLFLLIMMLPMIAKAQYNFDALSVRAYIEDHRIHRRFLFARSTLEAGNTFLHEASADAAYKYKELNFDLDKYTRAFDVIDMIFQSVRTGMNVYSTYNTVSDRIKGYKTMLEEYNDKVLKRGKVEVSDTLILSVNYYMLENVAKQAKELYKSVSELALYVTGVAACSTSQLHVLLNNINDNLDNIEFHITTAYFQTWRYIQLRIGYWKSELYNNLTKRQITNDAIGRWKKSAYQAIGKSWSVTNKP